MPAPSLGNVSVESGGRYPASTSRAAYSVPRWVELVQVESARISVNGCLASGWTHQTPLFENNTMRCPGCAPITRPSMTSSVSGPPLSAGGILVNRIDSGPSIRFTRIPPADKGGPDTLDVIEGRVIGAQPGQRIVLFSKSGVWWVQPEARQPFTEIRADSTWTSSTHLGTEYAALLVDAGYRPPLSTETLPREGAGIVAVTVVPGDTSARAAHHTLQFSGY